MENKSSARRPDVNEPGPIRQTPSIDWSEADLHDNLANAWDMLPSQIMVIGQISPVEGAGHAFLKNLRHPGTGHQLLPPAIDSRAHESAFIAPKTLREFQKNAGTATFAIAKLEISPREERRRRNDPFACKVSDGTLDPLSHIPDDWLRLYNLQGVDEPLIPSKIREFVEEQLRRDTQDTEATLSAAILEGENIRFENQKLKKEQSERRRHVRALEKEFQQKGMALNSRYREMESLLREKGERLIALELLDRTDLEKIVPPLDRADQREGYRFEEALGGELSRLAAYIQVHLWRQGTHYSRAQLLDFITLLRTRDLIVLAGDSGSGKTSMVKSVASAIGGRCTIVPVKPNWTSSEDLLGYYNPIEQRFHPSQFLEALLNAKYEPDVPHFICLDEMNLARVEYYFSDFLSLLETRTETPEIKLYSIEEERQTARDNKIFLSLIEKAKSRAGMSDDASMNDILENDQAGLELNRLMRGQEGNISDVLDRHAKLRRSIADMIQVPPLLHFPPNVWIIGTVNIDETTHYLSPKVLDRSHIMRFRNLILDEWNSFELELEDFDLDMSQPMNIPTSYFPDRNEYPTFDPTDPDVEFLVKLSREYLNPLGIEFGMRAIRQSISYFLRAEEIGIEKMAALNNIVLHKILPKISLDVEKTTSKGEKRRDVLIGLRDTLENRLKNLDERRVSESAVESLDELIKRAEGNNGIANFWSR